MASSVLVQLLVVLLALASIISTGHSLRILGLFPHPGVSHFHFFHPIMRGLAEKGHEVTVISHFPDKSPTARYNDLPLTGRDTLMNAIDLKWGKESCNHTLRSDALAQVLRERTRYDIIIMEQFNTDCMMGVAHVLKAPVIALSSCAMMPWHYDRMGMPIAPSYIPALFLGQSEEMNFGGRLANWITFHGMRFLYNWFSVPAADSYISYKFGHDIPSVSELTKETALYFVNQHFSLTGAKPLPPSVIELGGIHIQRAKALPAELQRFLDNAEHGVVFISWGSMIRAESMPAAKREGILRAIKRLKQRVVWKWENDTLDNKPDNLFISKWLPQRDILCHPNVKVFMTHGGLMGSSEAAWCGVPVVTTPMYGDQFLNSAAMRQRGMGVLLNYEDISENTVMRSIKEALKARYMDNAKVVSYSYKHRPQTALETAIWWVEYAARTDGAPLAKSSSIYMSAFTYYSLDVYLVVGNVLAIALCSWMIVFRKFCGGRREVVEKFKDN